MEFEVSDIVVYGTDGVCVITDICRKAFRDRMIRYYVLKPVFNTTAVLFVPVDCDNASTRMRKALTARQIRDNIRKTPNKECTWIENENERKAAFKEILHSGDSKQLARLIKTLHLHQKKQQALGKKMHLVDEKFFKDAEKILYEEMAVALGITPAEVGPYIDKLLK